MFKISTITLVLITFLLITIVPRSAQAQINNIKELNLFFKSNSTGKLNSLRAYADGNYMIIVFFSTECPICNMQLPSVERLHLAINLANKPDKKKLPPTKIVSIAFDTWAEKTVQPFMQENKYSFDVWYDPMARKTNRPFKIDKDGIPAVYIYRPDGTLLKKGVGFIRDLDTLSLKLIVEDSK